MSWVWWWLQLQLLWNSRHGCAHGPMVWPSLSLSPLPGFPALPGLHLGPGPLPAPSWTCHSTMGWAGDLGPWWPPQACPARLAMGMAPALLAAPAWGSLSHWSSSLTPTACLLQNILMREFVSRGWWSSRAWVNGALILLVCFAFLVLILTSGVTSLEISPTGSWR